MFLHVSGILFTGGLWYPSMPCCRSQVGVVSQHALQVSRPIPGGKLRGLASGRGVSRPTPKGEVEGSGLGSLQAHPLGSLQAHTGGLSRPTLGVSPGPQLGGLQAHTWGGVSWPTPRGCIPAYCGRYASYWNVFLQFSMFSKVSFPQSN